MPDYNIFQLLLNSSGAALVTGLFIFYLLRKDKQSERKDEMFNGIIQDYLRDSIKIKQDLAEKMQRITDVLENLEYILNKRIMKVLKAAK